jgi:phytoene/squalene synthetase
MTDHTAQLAQSITYHGSKQTYFTARILVDKDLTGDFFRSYAYFRWMDDIIDIHSQTDEERILFIERQKNIINGLFNNVHFDDLTIEEEMLVDLIQNNPSAGSGLESFIRNMFAIIEFDARRKGRLITRDELIWYTTKLGRSVTDGILYFVGNGQPEPTIDHKYLAGTAAHIAHLLRDMLRDMADGFINIPREYLEEHGISHENIDSVPFKSWVQARVRESRDYFHDGKKYLEELGELRRKIVGYWYCARFEGVLDAIERDGYILRDEYPETHSPLAWFRFAWILISVTARHLVRRVSIWFRN